MRRRVAMITTSPKSPWTGTSSHYGTDQAFALDYARHLARAEIATYSAAKEAAYLRAVELAPTRVEAHEGLLAMTEETERRLAVAEAWCTADTASARARLTRCELLVDLDRLPEAEGEAAAILARWPEASGAWLSAAWVSAQGFDEEHRHATPRGTALRHRRCCLHGGS